MIIRLMGLYAMATWAAVFFLMASRDTLLYEHNPLVAWVEFSLAAGFSVLMAIGLARQFSLSLKRLAGRLKRE